ncbi:DUF1538 domain-containing protein [Candidatus Vondammii sp. HM_W22]|uniref:DUF1538 domain-containing protein n=1 Tax=Candidatus Vondammii sp. HM_W22 TaxID=2687299 RepID=UPI001F12E598|nr:DUF1538 domain-containing protein [Candidatus Vondammii sp. HM_W22]
MISWAISFFHTLLDTITDVLPIAGILFGFQLLILRKQVNNTGQVLGGFVFVLVGLAFFLQGLEQALFPLGKLMAEQLTSPEFLGIQQTADEISGNWQYYLWVYIFAFAIGFSTAIAEPSVMAVAIKANQVSGGAVGTWGLRLAVALGVAVGISIGAYRIVTGTPLHYYIITGYVIVIVQTLFCPKSIIALAYDSGGVATSTVTVPLVAALGLGLASNIPGRNPMLDGFGLIAFASLFPIISVMGYAQISEWLAHRAQRTQPGDLGD